MSAVEYLVWTRALAPECIVIVDANNQTGEPGQCLAQPIRVRIEDQYGNGVYDQPVTFQVTTGGGHVERTTVRTDPSGVVGTVWAHAQLALRKSERPGRHRRSFLRRLPLKVRAKGSSSSAEMSR